MPNHQPATFTTETDARTAAQAEATTWAGTFAVYRSDEKWLIMPAFSCGGVLFPGGFQRWEWLYNVEPG